MTTTTTIDDDDDERRRRRGRRGRRRPRRADDEEPDDDGGRVADRVEDHDLDDDGDPAEAIRPTTARSAEPDEAWLGRDRDDDPSRRPTGRRRPPPGRVSPEALAAARGGAVEGLEWLGRPPEAKASILYRLLRLVARFVIFVVFRFRIRDVRAGAPAARAATCWSAAAHRGWMDPFVVMHALPAAAARLVPRQRALDLHLALA